LQVLIFKTYRNRLSIINRLSRNDYRLRKKFDHYTPNDDVTNRPLVV